MPYFFTFFQGLHIVDGDLKIFDVNVCPPMGMLFLDHSIWSSSEGMYRHIS